MKVLVLGGTGFISGRCVQALLSRGFEVLFPLCVSLQPAARCRVCTTRGPAACWLKVHPQLW